MQILTAAEMGAGDQRTAQEFNLPLGDLMQNAGFAVAKFARSFCPALKNVVLLCGTGNNGGDGFVAAAELQKAGVAITVVLVGDPGRMTAESKLAFAAIGPSDVKHIACRGDGCLPEVERALQSADLVIDAIVGTGFKPPLRGVAAGVREMLAKSSVPVIAVDVPSGWDADSMEETVDGACRADAVVTFTTPKNAHVFGHLTSDVFGPVIVAPIGSPDAAVASSSGLIWTGTSKKVFEKARPIDSNKGMYGHVLVVGGSTGKAGAPAMAALAALRSGAGLVTVAVPKPVLDTVAGFAPEFMTVPLDAADDGSVSESNAGAEQRDQLLKRIGVLAIGPGLGSSESAGAFARTMVTETTLPVVIDADGLNAFKGHAELLQGHGRTMVLTPHPGEMGTLLGISTKDVQADRLNLARKFATEHGVTLVLKGWRTLVAHPDGRVAVNTSGNPCMAKGGSGDILTGIVAACVAQKPDDVFNAVNAAVYLHGLAGDFAVHAQEEHTVLATDTLAHLSDAFRYRTADANGLEWIAGLRMGTAR